MRRFSTVLSVALLLISISGSQAWASGLHLAQAGGSRFPHEAFLLSLSSRAVPTPRQIVVTEDEKPVQGLSVAPASQIGQSHFGTVLVIDTSDSMKGVAERSAIQAARAFIRARNPAQLVGIVMFDQTARVVAPMTTDNATLDQAVAGIPTLHSGTHMFDAVSEADRLLAGANLTGGSVVVVSDGRDTGSQIGEQSVAKDATAQGVRVYTVGVRDASFDGATLRGLAAAARGVYTPVGSNALVSLYHQLGVALSNQYLIRYTSRASLGSNVTVAVHVAGYGVTYASYRTPAAPPVVAPGPTVRPSSFWTSTGAAVLVSLVCAVLVGLAILALITRRAGVRQRVAPFVGFLTRQDEPKPRSLVQRALGDPRSRRVEKSRWSAVLAEEIDIARIQVSLPRLMLITVAGTAALAYGLASLEGPLAILVALAVPVLARIGIRAAANRQRQAFSEQLPENLAVVSSALRAGNTFVGSLGVVNNGAPEPSRRELRRALADEQLGVPLVDALNRVSDRMKSSDFRHVALVATLQAETGGNTAEVLDVVTETIRERLALLRLVRTLTAQGRLAGWLLSALPLALLLFMSLINPHYVSPLFHTSLGISALILGAVMTVSGTIIIRRIVDIDE